MLEDTTHLTARDAPISSVRPIVLADPDRPVPVQLRLTAPTTGAGLPIILFSHGHGESMDGYAPLTDWWASQGFVVVQPTYLDSRSVGITEGDPRYGGIWLQRAHDAHRVLDHLDQVLDHVPGLRERTDSTKIAAVGHSFGGQTAGILLGLGVIHPETGELVRLPDERVSTGVLLATAGRGADLSELAAERYPFMNPVFDQMHAPVLVVMGDHDNLPLTDRGPDWMADPYTDSPGEKHLLTVYGAEHSLGGIGGYDVHETTDENPARVRLVREVAKAFLLHGLNLDSGQWDSVRMALAGRGLSLGRIESKR